MSFAKHKTDRGIEDVEVCPYNLTTKVLNIWHFKSRNMSFVKHKTDRGMKMPRSVHVT